MIVSSTDQKITTNQQKLCGPRKHNHLPKIVENQEY
jgi:hypothetical protein